MNSDFWDSLKEIYINEDGTDENYIIEKEPLFLILPELEKKLLNQYEIKKPIGRGGAGIVIELWDKGIELKRALKIPRPIKDELLDTLSKEMEFLKSIDNENIIKVFLLGEIDIDIATIKSRKYPFFVMQYIDDAVDLFSKYYKLIDQDIEKKKYRVILDSFIENLESISKAIRYLHINDILHFDIKPSNILINKDEKPILTDLGFAKKKLDSDDKVIIGFTLAYAHPDLKSVYSRMSDKNRVKKEITYKEFNKTWDIYALGKSILEVLALINLNYSENVYLEYKFTYLHLLACRMLDGRNISKTEFDHALDSIRLSGSKHLIFSENWQDLEASELNEIKFENFDNIISDLNKIQSSDYFHKRIPELELYPLKRIHVSETNPASFTKRVQRIIEHPIFKRLINIHQLDLLFTVYPTATHTRFEHSIGVYRNCCLYINSLFNDKYNPLFKQLVNEDDLKAIILLSLIHDIGHYPFAHEIEDSTKEKSFKHENIMMTLLNSTLKDKEGHTFKELIENKEIGWGIKITAIESILESNNFQSLFQFQSKTLKNRMLLSILDGPIDVDKLDYLIRDSQNAYLKYGELIDFERLINNLTIITDKQDGKLHFTVGTYEKGQTAAESLIFARYLLYRSLYWHHTARSIRTMLTTAIFTIYEQKTDERRKTFESDFNDFIIPKGGSQSSFNYETLLKNIKKFSNPSGKELINQILDRTYYKRILTIHQNTKDENEREIIEDYRSLVKTKRSQLNKILQERIKYYYQDTIQKLDPSYRVSALSFEITNETIALLDKPYMILCDAPEPSLGIKGKTPRFIPEPQRLQYNYAIRKSVGIKVSDVWDEEYSKLMNIAAKGRIFCHPNIRNNIMAALNPMIIQKSLEESIKALK